MDFKLRDGESIRLMAPFADMLNHSPEVGQCHVYDPQSGNLSILAGKSYEPGDQVRLVLFSDAAADMRPADQKCTCRSSSITDRFPTTVFHVSMVLSCPVIPTTAMISCFRRIPWRPSLSKSTNSG